MNPAPSDCPVCTSVIRDRQNHWIGQPLPEEWERAGELPSWGSAERDPRPYRCRRCARVWHAFEDRYMGSHSWAELLPEASGWFDRDSGPVSVISALTEQALESFPATAPWAIQQLPNTLAAASAEHLDALATTIVRSFAAAASPSPERGRFLLKILKEVVHAAASWNFAPPEARRQYDEHSAAWTEAFEQSLHARPYPEAGTATLKSWLAENTPRPPKPGASRRGDAVIAIEGIGPLLDWAQADGSTADLAAIWREATNPFRWYALWMPDGDWERLREFAERPADR